MYRKKGGSLTLYLSTGGPCLSSFELRRASWTLARRSGSWRSLAWMAGASRRASGSTSTRSASWLAELEPPNPSPLELVFGGKPKAHQPLWIWGLRNLRHPAALSRLLELCRCALLFVCVFLEGVSGFLGRGRFSSGVPWNSSADATPRLLRRRQAGVVFNESLVPSPVSGLDVGVSKRGTP